MDEIWKDCYEWEEFYEVSSHGRVRSKLRKSIKINKTFYPKILNPIERNGYFCVNLSNCENRKTLYIHRLVLLSFCGKPENNQEACHKDGDRKNNNLSNLRWDTHMSNIIDRRNHGNDLIGEKAPHAKLNDFQVRVIKKCNITQDKLANIFNVHIETIGNIKRGKTWRHL